MWHLPDETDAYLAELTAEVGEPTADEIEQAEIIAERLKSSVVREKPPPGSDRMPG